MFCFVKKDSMGVPACGGDSTSSTLTFDSHAFVAVTL